MNKFWTRTLFYFGSLAACLVMAVTTGCASGGYKLTRKYASWVNSQNIIIRIVLYILTTVVFGVTLLIDTVVFNTMDFWQGKVSEGKYEFKDADKVYQVEHKIVPGTNLKNSTIKILNADNSVHKIVMMNETISGEIDLIIDGQLRSRVRNITTIPVAKTFDHKGDVVEEKVLLLDTHSFSSQFLAQQ